VTDVARCDRDNCGDRLIDIFDILRGRRSKKMISINFDYFRWHGGASDNTDEQHKEDEMVDFGWQPKVQVLLRPVANPVSDLDHWRTLLSPDRIYANWAFSTAKLREYG
jgi:hypothetical protein